MALVDANASLGTFKVRYKRKGDGRFTTLTGECYPSRLGDAYVTMILTEGKNQNEPNLVSGKPNYRTLIVRRVLSAKAQ